MTMHPEGRGSTEHLSRHILLDCDGVLLDFVGRLCEFAKMCGFKLRRCDIINWDVARLSPLALRDAVLPVLDTDEFWGGLSPLPGAQEAVQELFNADHRLDVATAPWEACVNWRRLRQEALNRYFPGVFDHVHFSHYKQMFPADVFVDDRTYNLETYRRTHPQARVICLDAAYNQDWTGERMKSLAELPRRLK